MSDTFKRIMNNLPDYLNKDPVQASGITMSYRGTAATVTIQTHQMTTIVNGGSGRGFSVDLTQYTMNELVTFILTQTGYTATLPDSSVANVAASSLMDLDGQSIAQTTNLFRFTSSLWFQVAPMVWAIEGLENDVKTATVDEESINTADGLWLDKWGDQYGEITRMPVETDSSYSARIKREVSRNRLAARNIEDIIWTELGVHVTVTDDQYKYVWEIGGILGNAGDGLGDKIFVDRGHERNQFWVNYDGPQLSVEQQLVLGPQIIALVMANRAAGCLPHFYIQGIQGYATAPPTYGQWNVGDIFINSNPTNLAMVGWVCINNELPEPGTWKPFGPVQTTQVVRMHGIPSDTAFGTPTASPSA